MEGEYASKACTRATAERARGEVSEERQANGASGRRDETVGRKISMARRRRPGGDDDEKRRRMPETCGMKTKRKFRALFDEK